MKLLETWQSDSRQEIEALFAQPNLTDCLIEQFGPLTEIFRDIRERGDEAIRAIATKDHGSAGEILCTLCPLPPEGKLGKAVPPTYAVALEGALERITSYYRQQLRHSWFHQGPNQELAGQRVSCIERIAILMPSAQSFSPMTLMMCAIPALVAGVPEIYLNIPPGHRPKRQEELFSWLCSKLNIRQVFEMPEVAAIFAFALGTETVPRVDKLVGESGPLPRAAATLVSGEVGHKIQPSATDTTILADWGVNPSYIAADVFAHAESAQATCVAILTPHVVTATEIIEAVASHPAMKNREGPLADFIDRRSAVILCRDLDEALALIRQHPPKHLSLFVEHPLEIMARAANAGVFYLGENTPAGIENYFASASNLIPSGRLCRFTSPLDADDFFIKSSLAYYSKNQLRATLEMVEALTHEDNLPFHTESFRIRLR